MSRLNAAAREQLKWAGVSVENWSRLHMADRRWFGDACGCPDDRCIGYHHDNQNDCQCLTVLLGVCAPTSTEKLHIALGRRNGWERYSDVEGHFYRWTRGVEMLLGRYDTAGRFLSGWDEFPDAHIDRDEFEDRLRSFTIHHQKGAVA